jgi:integrase
MDMLMTEAYGLWAAQTDCRPLTKRAYGLCLRHAMRFGLLRLSDCTLERVSAYARDLRARGLAHRTISNAMAALVAVLQACTLAGRFDPYALMTIKMMRPRQKRKRPRGSAPWLTPMQVEQLAEAAARIAPRMELPIRIGALTGARTGELGRMHRDDFSLGPKPFLAIHDLSDEYAERGTAKTGARTVPVCAELKALVLERGPKSGWLFPVSNRRGGRPSRAPFLSAWSLDVDFQFVRRAAGLGDEVKMTWLRHTRISTWLQANVSIHKVAAWSGNSVRVIEDAYMHLLPYDEDCEVAGEAPAA